MSCKLTSMLSFRLTERDVAMTLPFESLGCGWSNTTRAPISGSGSYLTEVSVWVPLHSTLTPGLPCHILHFNQDPLFCRKGMELIKETNWPVKEVGFLIISH